MTNRIIIRSSREKAYVLVGRQTTDISQLLLVSPHCCSDHQVLCSFCSPHQVFSGTESHYPSSSAGPVCLFFVTRDNASPLLTNTVNKRSLIRAQYLYNFCFVTISSQNTFPKLPRLAVFLTNLCSIINHITHL